MLDINNNNIDWAWKVDNSTIQTQNSAIKTALMDLTNPVYVAKNGTQTGVANSISASGATDVLAFAQKLNPEDLGDDAYKKLMVLFWKIYILA